MGRGRGRRYQADLRFPDEEPSEEEMEFIDDDEEIDEDTAFTAEDYIKYGDIGNKRSREEDDSADEEGGEYTDEEGAEFTSLTDLLDGPDSDEEEVNPSQHKKLLQSMQSLDGSGPPRKRHKALRSELHSESEYHLGPSAMRVEMADLLPSLQGTQEYGDLKQKLEKLHKGDGPVEAPLATHVKDKITRKAAYIKASKDVSRWQGTIRQNRIADQLQFPMNQPTPETVTSKSMASDFRPTNDLENAIAGVLEEGGIHEGKIQEFEGLATNKLSVEEVEARRNELAKMRSLMLYQERKKKHQNKIKSKRYRKMVRRAQDKEKLSMDELAAVDPDAYHKLMEEREMERIKERLTLKHSNTSKWAKRAVRQKDLNSRQAVQDQIDQGRELRRKMQNVHGSDSESDEEDSEEDIEAEYERLVAESAPEKGLHAMAFMKRAAEKQKEAFLDSLQPDDAVEVDDGPSGRRRFTPSTAEREKLEASSPAHAAPSPRGKKKQTQPVEESAEEETITGLEEHETSSRSKKTDSAQNPWMNLKGSAKAKKSKSSNAKRTDTELDVDNIISVSEEKLESNNLLSNQQELVEEAFAGLDVYKEFEEEKDALLEESDDETNGKGPNVQDLPGWGSWTGDGVKKSKRQAAREKRAKQKKEQEKKERNAARKDAALKHVIINERITKKFQKYQVQKLPFEFSNSKQYQHSLAQPLGAEWNTSGSYSKLNQAAVKVRAGLTIDPLSAPRSLAEKKAHKKNKK